MPNFSLVAFIILYSSMLIERTIAVNWVNGNWALKCDFPGNDLSNAKTKGEECGGLCARTTGCTHFTWTSHNSGTCRMKKGPVSKNQAIDISDPSSVCGIIIKSVTAKPNGGSLSNSNQKFLSTQHGAAGVGACELPKADYTVRYPIALGDIPELGNLRFSPDLCGHILTINCGNGDLDVIITDYNVGGGLDLYTSTWNKATSNRPPGITSCSAKLSSKSIFNFELYRCYHATGETNNQWYRNVGLLNTKNRIVKGASFNGKNGAHRGGNPYYAFDGFGTADQKVTFFFADGGEYKVTLKDCLSGANKQIWK